MMLNQVIRETESEKERKTKKESEKAKKTSCGSAGRTAGRKRIGI